MGSTSSSSNAIIYKALRLGDLHYTIIPKSVLIDSIIDEPVGLKITFNLQAEFQFDIAPIHTIIKSHKCISPILYLN